MTSATRLRIAAIVLFLGVSLGAFGAHGLADRLAETGRADNWETATLYLLVHGVVLFSIALSGARPIGFGWFLAGIILFSGSLYLLAVTGITKFGAITPLGGVSFLIGWGRWIFHKASAPI